MATNAAPSTDIGLRAAAALDFPDILKKAALAAFVTFLLAVSIVGIETVSSTGELTIATRYTEVSIAVVGVFLGSIAISLMRAGHPMPALLGAGAVTIALLAALVLEAEHEFFKSLLPFKSVAIDWGAVIIPAAIAARAAQLVFRARAKAAGRAAPTVAPALAGLGRLVPWIGVAFIVAAIALPWLPLGASQRKVIDICTLVLTYIMLGWGLNIVVGLAGLLDLGYVAFYAVGAYSYAMLASNFGWSFWVCLPFAGMLAASFGVLLGFPVLRLRGDYLAIVTLGFGEIIRLFLNNLDRLTNGPQGIARIDQPHIFGFALATPQDFFWLLLPLVAVAFTIVWRIENSILGLGWAAIREDQDAARGIGIDTTVAKLLAFGLSAILGGFAGVVFAGFQRFVDPVSFTFWESLTVVLIVVIGGLGNLIGILVGAAALIILPELLRGYSEYRMLLYGLALVVVILLRPRGLIDRRYNPAWLIRRLGWR